MDRMKDPYHIDGLDSRESFVVPKGSRCDRVGFFASFARRSTASSTSESFSFPQIVTHNRVGYWATSGRSCYLLIVAIGHLGATPHHGMEALEGLKVDNIQLQVVPSSSWVML